MNAQELASLAKSQIAAKKLKFIEADSIVSYFSLIKDTPNNEIDENKINLFFDRTISLNEHQRLTVKTHLEKYKSLFATSQFAIKSMISINGAASIAMLAFLGNLLNNDSELVTSLSFSLLLFAVGTLLGGVVSGFTHFAENRNVYGHPKIGDLLGFVAYVLGVFSYIFFIWGIWSTFIVLANAGTQSSG